MKRPRQRDSPSSDNIALAVECHQAGQLDRAHKMYQALLDGNPDHVDALHYMGVLHHQRGNTEAGIPLIERAVRLRPDYVDAHNNLGNALRAQGRHDDAARAYRAALALDPDHTNAAYNLALVEDSDTRLIDTADACERRLVTDPTNVEARYLLGLVRYRQERLDEAEQALERVVLMSVAHADAHYQLGRVRAKKQDAQGAILAYRTAIGICPGHRPARQGLAAVYYQAGCVDEARTAYAEWRRIDPEHPVPLHMLAALGARDIAVPDQAAPDYVRHVFDGFAATFDQRLARLQYRAPELVANAVRAACQGDEGRDTAPFERALDAGCGTGLAGAFVRPLVTHLAGIDLSGAMLAKARERGTYDELFEEEIVAFLERTPRSFDLITSSDTFNYFGDLARLLTAAARALRPGGLLVFTLECATPGVAYRLEPHGRYSHGEDYVRRTLATASLHLHSLATDCLRNESGRPVAGWIVTARRP